MAYINFWLREVNIGLFTGLSALICIGAILVAVAVVVVILVLTILYEKKREAEKTNAVQIAPFVVEAVKPVQVAPIVEKKTDTMIVAPIVEKKPEPVQVAPIVEKKPEPVQVAPIVVEAVKPVQVAPIVVEVVEQAPIVEVTKKPVAPPKRIKKVVKKADNWDHFDGNFDGYHYDPEDACYYEGEAPEGMKAKLEEKEREYQEANKVTGKKEVLIKRIVPPFATLKTAKHRRQAPAKVEGFDESVIYGKYVIEHVGEEFFYTLYSDKNKPLYLSGNYSSLEYAQKAVHRFRTHVIVGSFTVEEAENKFHFVLKRKTYTHRGDLRPSRIEAETHVTDIKKFALSDIVRAQ